jgi:2-phosphosulfolactate phosphatase
LRTLRRDFIILCSGKIGEFSLEDTVCAGLLIEQVIKDTGQKYHLTDPALGAVKLFTAYRNNIIGMLQESEHGKFLRGLGFGDDLEACSKVDSFSCLPVLKGGLIRLIGAFESDPKLRMKKVASK